MTTPFPHPVIRPTTRQIQVLCGIARGHGNAEIAARLRVSPATVQGHVERLGRRLDTTDRAEMVAIGYRCGWLANLPPESRPKVMLNHRSKALLQHMAGGRSNKEIAAELNVTVGAVKGYGTRLFYALAARNRAHAVALAYQHGYLFVPGDPVHGRFSVLGRARVGG